MYFRFTLKISIFALRNKNYNHRKKIKSLENMTKAEIINKIVLETGISKKDVAGTIEAFMEEIRQSMSVRKENVYLRGFGTFTVKHRAQKTARNISKNTTLVIDAHDFPAFKPAKSFIAKMK
ncbi:integration host factor subunit beta [Prevotella brevis]|uniref:Integration host factor subunit beta n=2 Tax=Bacteroidales TaxID=171549 RepID=A0ABS9CHJ1_9BACT|nr:integration host factor subunit beta [Prevotella sp.]MCF2559133.1 integration host factor subunit beta [Xylanibacter brevis]MCF2564466.1 integration host factor subunit beta [Xylanibacter brevis]